MKKVTSILAALVLAGILAAPISASGPDPIPPPCGGQGTGSCSGSGTGGGGGGGWLYLPVYTAGTVVYVPVVK